MSKSSFPAAVCGQYLSQLRIIPNKILRRGGGAVERTGLENRQSLTGLASSNLALSAMLRIVARINYPVTDWRMA